MKKILAFLMACMLLMSIAPAFADVVPYTSVTPAEGDYTGENGTAMQLKHSLTLTDPGRTDIPYDITYKFAVDGPFVENPVIDPNDGNAAAKIAMMVTGSPEIADIEYLANNPLDKGTSTKNIEINWENVKIKEPGVYYWNVVKTESHTPVDGSTDPSVPTNNRANNKLYVVVTVNNQGALEVSNVRLVMDGATTANNKDNIEDQFPATTVDLSLSKAVTGTQASKNQYFQFKLIVTPLSGTALKEYTIDGVTPVPLTPYNDEIKTPTTSFEATGGNRVEVDLWLKHGQTVTIKDLPYGSSATLTEILPEGYTVNEINVSGASATTDTSAAVATISNLNADTNVAYLNYKDAQVPTGIDLQTGAPIMGLLAAAALMVLLFVGKRKEAAE